MNAVEPEVGRKQPLLAGVHGVPAPPEVEQQPLEAEAGHQALATAERTWQSLAWEASARVAMAEGDHDRARTCLERALSIMDGFKVPLAAWRVHGTAAKVVLNGGVGRILDMARSNLRHVPAAV